MKLPHFFSLAISHRSSSPKNSRNRSRSFRSAGQSSAFLNPEFQRYLPCGFRNVTELICVMCC